MKTTVPTIMIHEIVVNQAFISIMSAIKSNYMNKLKHIYQPAGLLAESCIS